MHGTFIRSVFLLYFLLTINSSVIFAQSNGDKLEQLKYDSLLIISDISDNDSLKISSLLYLASMRYPDNSFETTFIRNEFLTKAKNLAGRNDYLNFLAGKADAIGVNKRNQGQYNIALLLHEFALDVSESISNKYQSSIIYNNIGVVYRRIDEYKTALDYHIRALKLAEELGEIKSQAIAINSIGNIQVSLGNLDDAIVYFEQSLDLEKEMNNRLGIAINLNNLGYIYFIQENFEKALEYYEQSLDLNKRINSNRGMAICYSDIGKVFEKQDQFNKALEYYQRALSINFNHKDKIFLSDSYINIANVYIEKEEYSAAQKYVSQGLKIAKEIGAKENIMNANLVMYRIRKQNGQYQSALQHYDTFHIYKDSIMNISLQKEIASLKISFESERKESMISFLEQNSRIDQLEIKRQKIFFWLVLTAFITALIVVTFLAYYLYAKSNSNKLLERKNHEIDKARNNLENLAKDLLIAKQEAERSDKIKSEFLANISHEIRTPLNSVVGFSQLMAQFSLDKVQKDYLNSIQLSANSLLVLLNDILDLSKMEAGKITVEYKPMIIRNLFDELEVIFKDRAKENKLKLKIFVEDHNASTINFSDLRLRQIMLNLISNAIKFTNEGVVTVTVRTEKQPATQRINLFIEVKDTGVGIKLNEQINIFEPFYQLAGKNAIHGTGLGLAITKRLIEILNGTISLKSSENKGSVFSIVFSDVEVLEGDELSENFVDEKDVSYFDLPDELGDDNLDQLMSKISKISLEEPLLLKKLEELFHNEYSVAKETRLIDNIQEFNELLNQIAIDANQIQLQFYCVNLSKLINQFDIEGIETYFTKFEKVMIEILNL